MSTDVTKTRQRLAMEQAAILDSLPAHVAVLDSEGTILSVNEAWRRFATANVFAGSEFGVGSNYLEVCERSRGACAEEARQVGAGIRSVLDRQAPTYSLEYPCHAPDERRWFRVIVNPVSFDGIHGAVVMHMAVTEHHEAEQRLRENELRIRAIARATADVIWDWDLVRDVVWWNDGMSRVFGYPPGELEPGADSWTTRIHPDDRERVVDGLYAAIERRDENWQDTYRFLHHDGRVLDVSDRGHLILDEFGTPVRLVGGMTDITEQKSAHDRLIEQATLLDEAHDAILVRNLDHTIRFWNRGAQRIYGWSATEAVGRPIVDLIYQDNTDEFAAAQARVLTQGRWRGRIRQTRKDGRTLTVESTWSLVRDAAGEPTAVLAINTDISERLALEEQLRQAQRLEAVGQLTGGVAHDFNNLLQVILGNAEALEESLGPDHPLRILATLSRTAAERGAELTQRLLAFARRQALEPEPVDVTKLVAGMDALLRRTLGETIEIECIRGGGLWPALVDATQLESAILNLCINARDAMPTGGRLTIELANAHLDHEYTDQHPDAAPGQYVMVAVSDTGSGMSPEIAARAFEPFFTTKPIGKGSGLGLSMVYGFLKQSGGHIKIYSEVGQGTTVRLYLPRTAGGLPAPAPHHEPDGSGGTGERILVVEDDELVREHVGAQLRSLGYRVFSVRTAAEALEALEHSHDFALLFTDIVIPGGMNGRELADEAQRRFPKLPVLFTSGYTENAIVHHGRLDPGVLLLNKPYRRIELARKVQLALDRGRP